MESLPTVDQVNLNAYYEVIRKLDPELYLIKIALQETSVNPLILPKIIRMISNVHSGTGWGKVQIIIQNGVIKRMLSEELESIEEVAIIDI